MEYLSQGQQEQTTPAIITPWHSHTRPQACQAQCPRHSDKFKRARPNGSNIEERCLWVIKSKPEKALSCKIEQRSK